MKTLNTNIPLNEVVSFLQKDIPTYLYILGGMEDRFNENTAWLSLNTENGITALALINTNDEIPHFIALTHLKKEDAKELLNLLCFQLPEKLYAYIAKGILDNKTEFKTITDHGIYLQMYLKQIPEDFIDESIRELTIKDEPDIQHLLDKSYMGNWFETSMLVNGKYVGYYENDILIGIAGTSVYSEKYGIASLGNIATLPSHRGKGISRKLTCHLIHKLMPQTPHIGLSVHSSNKTAIAMYEKMGFYIVDEYEYKLVERI